jgi:hypothetical protein
MNWRDKKCSWKTLVDDILVDFKDTGYEDADWTNLAEDRDWCQILVNIATNLQV